MTATDVEAPNEFDLIALKDVTDFLTVADIYKRSIAGGSDSMFDLRYQWQDKPHRHVYDLCRRLEQAADAIEHMAAEVAGLRALLRSVAIPRRIPSGEGTVTIQIPVEDLDAARAALGDTPAGK